MRYFGMVSSPGTKGLRPMRGMITIEDKRLVRRRVPVVIGTLLLVLSHFPCCTRVARILGTEQEGLCKCTPQQKGHVSQFRLSICLPKTDTDHLPGVV